MEVSPLPSRALHPLPPVPQVEPPVSPVHEVILRKHSKQSLSQPTIPEEGPEHAEDPDHQGSISQGPAATPTPVSVMRPKPELKVVKNLSQESSTGAISKDSSSCNMTKSGQRKEEPPQKQSTLLGAVPRSPKSLRQESVERLLKAIRGTSRQENKSRKRENSISPSKQATLGENQAASGPHLGQLSKSNKKDGSKKNAQEKRDIFRSLH